MNTARSVLLTFLLLVCHAQLFAQLEDKEPRAVIEVGGVPTWSATEGGSSFGPTVGVEVTAVENRLELELATTALFSHRVTEWSTDLLVKKPWTLSPKTELMFGAGPGWRNE